MDFEMVAQELGNGPWADKRLGRRVQLIAERLGPNPALSFPKALHGSAELEGAYRFLSNPLVAPASILSGHYSATRERALEEPCVLIVHDTTTCRFRPDGERKGLGRLVKSGQAFFAHMGIALADDGTRRPLGITNLHTWVRGDGEQAPGTEQLRWGEGVKATGEHLQGANLIHVMDREADDYALFSQLCANNELFVIRSARPRLLKTTNREKRTLKQAVAMIQQEVGREARLSQRKKSERSPIQLKIHPPRSSRIAELAIGFATVTLSKPPLHPRNAATRRHRELAQTITVNVVRVWEPHPPANEPGVEWVLLTNTTVENADDALRVVDRYRARWTIEEYFKALKTGCAYETRQLGDYDSLVNALAVFAPIACSLLWLRTATRRTPDAAAQTVLSSDEIDVLRALGRVPLPPSSSARQALLAVASLGGHVKWSGEPGWLTLWRGYAELRLLTKGWVAAKLQASCDQR